MFRCYDSLGLPHYLIFLITLAPRFGCPKLTKGTDVQFEEVKKSNFIILSLIDSYVFTRYATSACSVRCHAHLAPRSYQDGNLYYFGRIRRLVCPANATWQARRQCSSSTKRRRCRRRRTSCRGCSCRFWRSREVRAHLGCGEDRTANILVSLGLSHSAGILSCSYLLAASLSTHTTLSSPNVVLF